MSSDGDKQMVADIRKAIEEDAITLTEWEDTFITSVIQQLERGGSLSEKQDAKLLQIWEKATSA